MCPRTGVLADRPYRQDEAKFLVSTSKPGDEIAKRFDGRACCYRKNVAKGKLANSSKLLVNLLPAEEIGDSKIMDIGCGPGGLVFELLGRGAKHGTGVDISPKMIERAQELAASQNLVDRTTFRSGDGAEIRLDPHDIVLLDRTICCYPFWEPLLENSLKATRKYYGYSIPRDRGLMGHLIRAVKSVGNLIISLSGSGFRSYVHPTDSIQEHVESAGFSLRAAGTTGPWLTAVYARDQRPDL